MPIRIEDIRPELRETLHRKWAERGFRISFPEFLALYVWAYNRAEELGFSDPEVYVLEMLDELDPNLTYDELKAEFEMKALPAAYPPAEAEELEYWKRRAEELERELEEIKKKVPFEKQKELEAEIKKLKDKYERLKTMFERIKRTPGLTEEDVIRIMKNILKPGVKEIFMAIKALRQSVDALWKSYREGIKRVREEIRTVRPTVRVEIPKEVVEAVTKPYLPTVRTTLLRCRNCGKEFISLDRECLFVLAKLIPLPSEYYFYCDECRDKKLGFLPLEVYLQDLIKPTTIGVTPIPPEYLRWVASCTAVLKRAKGLL